MINECHSQKHNSMHRSLSFVSGGIWMNDFPYGLLEQQMTITADVYCQQHEQVKQALRRKCRNFVNNKGVIAQQDNAEVPSAKETEEKKK